MFNFVKIKKNGLYKLKTERRNKNYAAKNNMSKKTNNDTSFKLSSKMLPEVEQ
jgi:hypothetical protein